VERPREPSSAATSGETPPILLGDAYVDVVLLELEDDRGGDVPRALEMDHRRRFGPPQLLTQLFLDRSSSRLQGCVPDAMG